ncbi:MAG: hypothetical protein R2733_10665 [Acidimicrobiales bacterium]
MHHSNRMSLKMIEVDVSLEPFELSGVQAYAEQTCRLNVTRLDSLIGLINQISAIIRAICQEQEDVFAGSDHIDNR